MPSFFIVVLNFWKKDEPKKNEHYIFPSSRIFLLLGSLLFIVSLISDLSPMRTINDIFIMLCSLYAMSYDVPLKVVVLIGDKSKNENFNPLTQTFLSPNEHYKIF